MDAAKKASQLQKELDQIATQLNVKETDTTWQKMDAKLKELTKMIHRHAEAHRILFTVAIRQMKENIISCLQSERTRLSGTTCEFLVTTANVSPALSASVNDFFLPSLIKLCGRANKIFVQKATSTLHTLLQVGSPEQYLTELFRASKATSNTVRLAITHSLLLLLESHGLVHERWEPYLPTLEQELKLLSQDKAPDVRQKARMAIQVYLKTFVQRSQGFKDTLPSSVQKALECTTSTSSKSSDRVIGFKRPGPKLLATSLRLTLHPPHPDLKTSSSSSSSTLTSSSILATPAPTVQDTPNKARRVLPTTTTTTTITTSSVSKATATTTLEPSFLSPKSAAVLFTPIKPYLSSPNSSFLFSSATPELTSSPVAMAADPFASSTPLFLSPSPSTTSTSTYASSQRPSSLEASTYPSKPQPLFSSPHPQPPPASTPTVVSSPGPLPPSSSFPSFPSFPSSSSSSAFFLSSSSSSSSSSSQPLFNTPTKTTQNVPTLIMETRSSQPTVRTKAFEKLAPFLPSHADLSQLQLSLIDCHIANGLHMLDAKLLAVVLTNLHVMLQRSVIPATYFEKILTRCLVIRHNVFLARDKTVLQPCLAILAHFSTAPHASSLPLLLTLLQRHELKLPAKQLVLTWILTLLEEEEEEEEEEVDDVDVDDEDDHDDEEEIRGYDPALVDRCVQALHPLMAEKDPSLEAILNKVLLRLYAPPLSSLPPPPPPPPPPPTPPPSAAFPDKSRGHEEPKNDLISTGPS